ncbi:MAG: TetR/AcrR family transcriptional regulator, partial [Longimicrobiales bacterium]
AGRRLFARHGYDATSIRQLTADAGANLGAVTYHFGSKQGLYHAVVERALTPFADRVVAASHEGADALERATSVVRAYFEVLRAYPDVPMLLLQELMAGRVTPPPVTTALQRVTTALDELVTKGQAEGSVRAGDPLLFGLSIIAQPIHLTIVANMLAHVAGLDQSDATTRARVYAHTAAFVRAGLRAEDER